MYIEVQSMKNRILERKLGFLQRLLVQEISVGKQWSQCAMMLSMCLCKKLEKVCGAAYTEKMLTEDLKHIDEVEKMVI